MISRVSRFYLKCALAEAPKGAYRIGNQVKMSSNSKNIGETKVKKEACGDLSEEPEEDEMEEMFVKGPAGMEWGVPRAEVRDQSQQGSETGKEKAVLVISEFGTRRKRNL